MVAPLNRNKTTFDMTTLSLDHTRETAKAIKSQRHYDAIRNYLAWSWDATIWDGIEADDAVAIEATELGEKGIIVSLDKDLDQVPGWHFNFVKRGLYYLTPEESMFLFYKQFLTGDAVDNIQGAWRIGEKRRQPSSKVNQS